MEKITVDEIIKLPKEILKNKIIVFPTDTVYGVGCLYLDEVGINKIYNMKKRDYGKPLPILVSSVDMAKTIGEINSNSIEYTKKWPGALTIILKTIDINNPLETVAIRIPDSNISLKLINHFGPLHTTSVNYSGEKELNSVNEIEEKFSEFVDYIITDEATFSKTPSTIISCIDKEMKVLRQGSIYFNK